MKMKNSGQTKKSDIPKKEEANSFVWQKPNFSKNNPFIKQIRLPGSQHRG